MDRMKFHNHIGELIKQIINRITEMKGTGIFREGTRKTSSSNTIMMHTCCTYIVWQTGPFTFVQSSVSRLLNF